jgi:hypothetical protein
MPDSPKETRNLVSKNGMLKVIGDDCFTALRSCQELLEECQKDDPTIVWDTLNASFREPRCETDSFKIDAYQFAICINFSNRKKTKSAAVIISVGAICMLASVELFDHSIGEDNQTIAHWSPEASGTGAAGHYSLTNTTSANQELSAVATRRSTQTSVLPSGISSVIRDFITGRLPWAFRRNRRSQ